MNPLITDLPVVHLKPGELYFSEKPELVFTILGSCISIVMYHPYYELAAICHSLLPHENNPVQGWDKQDNFRYLDQAFHAMYQRYVNRGIKNHEIIVKVFGGGEVLQINGNSHLYGKNGKSVGTRNIDAVLHLVKEKNLEIAAIDVGGDAGRKLFFYTHTGEVLLKRVKKINGAKIYEIGLMDLKFNSK